MQATMTNAIDQLDRWGKPAWIALMVASFIIFWPLGLALLAYMIWSGRMRCETNRWGSWKSRHGVMGSTGNRAFDDYREETLKRLEDEAREFKAFVEKLRFAKDKDEFDRFMADRRANGGPVQPSTGN
ncbi:MAG: DUF2852 domain-containing protein [Hyphomicrobiaceae bacterium]